MKEFTLGIEYEFFLLDKSGSTLLTDIQIYNFFENLVGLGWKYLSSTNKHKIKKGKSILKFECYPHLFEIEMEPLQDLNDISLELFNVLKEVKLTASILEMHFSHNLSYNKKLDYEIRNRMDSRSLNLLESRINILKKSSDILVNSNLSNYSSFLASIQINIGMDFSAQDEYSFYKLNKIEKENIKSFRSKDNHFIGERIKFYKTVFGGTFPVGLDLDERKNYEYLHTEIIEKDFRDLRYIKIKNLNLIEFRINPCVRNHDDLMMLLDLRISMLRVLGIDK